MGTLVKVNWEYGGPRLGPCLVNTDSVVLIQRYSNNPLRYILWTTCEEAAPIVNPQDAERVARAMGYDLKTGETVEP